ncbi:hypothetical protein C4K05_0768 [Pseudomonas chlororaphis subsp. aureofaciens]|nr:hypothetical protein C4K06_0741 [Pseudomonas chlororaphis subsp. aureofaciens]AZE40135.1 hypothetical protein C4K05_0768 [Pseudomonas chlororaphis subsp. aureofaciens]
MPVDKAISWPGSQEIARAPMNCGLVPPLLVPCTCTWHQFRARCLKRLRFTRTRLVEK